HTRSTLFPYTTLFRSGGLRRKAKKYSPGAAWLALPLSVTPAADVAASAGSPLTVYWAGVMVQLSAPPGPNTSASFGGSAARETPDRKSTRLNSSHQII